MLLLEYRTLTDPSIIPSASVEVWTEGILELTIISWYWNDGTNGILKRGWLEVRQYNFDHPNMVASIKESHRQQQEILNRKPYRYPLWM